jgi:hypothetical protein
MKKILRKALKEGHERYPYAGTFAGELFGMTPDDYRLNGWKAAVPYTVEATLQHVKSTLETNVKKCNAGEVYGAVYGAGYHKAVNDVISLVDSMLNSLKKEHENDTKMD